MSQQTKAVASARQATRRVGRGQQRAAVLRAGYTPRMELAAWFEHVVEFSPADARLARVPTSGGVYLLTDAENQMIQLAATADLKRALLHRLCPDSSPAELSGQADEFPTQPAEPTEPAGDASLTPAGDASKRAAPGRPRINLSEVVRRVWWQPAHSQFELAFVYYQIARVLMPHTYRKQLAFGPAWFVHVDPAAPFPQFAAAKFLRSLISTSHHPGGASAVENDQPLARSDLSPPAGGFAPLGVDAPAGVDLGPFATQADATRFIDILQDTFDLCRYQNILEQAPHGQACAYFEMGKCPAPCDGTIPLAEYREMIAAALDFARGRHEPTYQRIEATMRAAAARQAYERAAALRRQLERARTIEQAAFARVAPLEDFNYLILQRGPGTTRLKPFFVRQGVITPGEPVKAAQLAGVLPVWRQRLCEPFEPIEPDARSEHVWLVSHFLFKTEKPGVYLLAGELDVPETALERIAQQLPGRRPAPRGGRLAATAEGNPPDSREGGPEA